MINILVLSGYADQDQQGVSFAHIQMAMMAIMRLIKSDEYQKLLKYTGTYIGWDFENKLNLMKEAGKTPLVFICDSFASGLLEESKQEELIDILQTSELDRDRVFLFLRTQTAGEVLGMGSSLSLVMNSLNCLAGNAIVVDTMDSPWLKLADQLMESRTFMKSLNSELSELREIEKK